METAESALSSELVSPEQAARPTDNTARAMRHVVPRRPRPFPSFRVFVFDELIAPTIEQLSRHAAPSSKCRSVLEPLTVRVGPTANLRVLGLLAAAAHANHPVRDLGVAQLIARTLQVELRQLHDRVHRWLRGLTAQQRDEAEERE